MFHNNKLCDTATGAGATTATTATITRSGGCDDGSNSTCGGGDGRKNEEHKNEGSNVIMLTTKSDDDPATTTPCCSSTRFGTCYNRTSRTTSSVVIGSSKGASRLHINMRYFFLMMILVLFSMTANNNKDMWGMMVSAAELIVEEEEESSPVSSNPNNDNNVNVIGDSMLIGGASSDKSKFVRTIAGIREACRAMLKVFTEKPKHRQPTKVKLIIVGFARTGTTSFVQALKQLGYTPAHDNEVIEIAELMGRRFDEINPMPIDEFLIEYGQLGFDVLFYFSYDIVDYVVQYQQQHQLKQQQQLDANNSIVEEKNDDELLFINDIKFVLTIRDNGRKWAESWSSVGYSLDILMSRPFNFMKSMHGILKVWKHILWDIQTNFQPKELRLDIPTLEKAYYAHIDRIRTMIPATKLLLFNVKDGWEPLCNFLQKPIPTGLKFPHVNDRVVMKALLGTLWIVTWIWPLFPIIFLYCVMSMLRFLKRRLLLILKPTTDIATTTTTTTTTSEKKKQH